MLPIFKELGILEIAMPADQNSHGAIFGGWLLGRCDLAGTIVCRRLQEHPGHEDLLTVSVKDFTFNKPVYIGDVIECWVSIMEIGNTSITAFIDVNVRRKEGGVIEKSIASGTFKYVNVYKGKPKEVKKMI